MAKVWKASDVRKLRYKLRLTQADFGARLGVSGGTISQWENGRRVTLGAALDSIERTFWDARAGLHQQLREFAAETLEERASGNVRIALLREIYLAWVHSKGDGRANYRDFDEGLEELGFKTRVGQLGRVLEGYALKALPGSGHDRVPEPLPGPGPDYAPKDGKLANVPHVPEMEEVEQQTRLHDRLRTKVDGLAAALTNAGNQFAELMRAVDEYAAVLREPTDELDVVALWSVGGSLHALLGAYQAQQLGTLAPPLEPQMAAALSSVVRDHGAFVLGFEEGRSLVERADQFAMQPELIADIAEPGATLLEELATNEDLVEEETRKVHATVRDALNVAGWHASRTTFAAYAIIRNAFRAVIKFSVGQDPSVLAVLGGVAGVSAILGDPNCEFIRAAVPVIRQHGSQLLAFFNHSPEFRAYVEWALEMLERDQDAGKGDR